MMLNNVQYHGLRQIGKNLITKRNKSTLMLVALRPKILIIVVVVIMIIKTIFFTNASPTKAEILKHP